MGEIARQVGRPEGWEKSPGKSGEVEAEVSRDTARKGRSPEADAARKGVSQGGWGGDILVGV